MNMTKRGRKPGFTLVELLTVIAIIGILIGILLPGLNAARNQARKASTAGFIKSLDTSCEMFQNDNKEYPKSGMANPFETTAYGANPTPPLPAAMAFAMQLMGPDQSGYVQPTLSNDTSASGQADGKINQEDWIEWYKVGQTKTFARVGPYIEPNPKNVTFMVRYLAENSEAGSAVPPELLGTPDGGTGGSNQQFNNGRIPFFVDGFGYPIIYYRSNKSAKAPFTTGSPGASYLLGNYDHSHNAGMTGFDEVNGQFTYTSVEGWDFAGVGASAPNEPVHPLGFFGYDETKPTKWPGSYSTKNPTFATYMLSREIFDQNKTTGSNPDGKLVPHRKEAFVIISPGRDGLFGTQDDVRNFGN